jgi:hypothetical protein
MAKKRIVVGALERAEQELGIVVGAPPAESRQVRIAEDYAQGQYRVQPLPFDGDLLTANGVVNLVATADRPCKPVKLILYNSLPAAGVEVNIDGITIQGINQLLGAGLMPITGFAEDAPSEDLPWDFAVLLSNGTMVVTGNLVGYTTGNAYVWGMAKVIAAQA